MDKENVKVLSKEEQAVMNAWSKLTSIFEVPRLGML